MTPSRARAFAHHLDGRTIEIGGGRIRICMVTMGGPAVIVEVPADMPVRMVEPEVKAVVPCRQVGRSMHRSWVAAFCRAMGIGSSSSPATSPAVHTAPLMVTGQGSYADGFDSLGQYIEGTPSMAALATDQAAGPAGAPKDGGPSGTGVGLDAGR